MKYTNVDKLKNYLSMRMSILYKNYKYQYFNGTLRSDELDEYYEQKHIMPARDLISREWNNNSFFTDKNLNLATKSKYIPKLKKEFTDKIKEYRIIESDILRQYIKMVKKTNKNLKITSPERYLSKVSDKKRIEIWTKIFNSLSINNNKVSPQRLVSSVLSIVEIDKGLWINYAKKISLYSRGFFKDASSQQEALLNLQKSFKKNRKGTIEKISKAFEKGLLEATNNAFRDKVSAITKDFTNALDSNTLGKSPQGMKKIIKSIFEEHTSKFIKYVGIEKNKIEVIIDEDAKNPFLRYEILDDNEYGNLVSKELQKETSNFYSALIAAIENLETNVNYKTINNETFNFTEEDKETVINFLNKNKSTMQKKVIMLLIKNNGVITGQIGEFQALLGLPIIGVVREIKKVGQSNDFVDLIGSFKISETEWKKYGINVKRFTEQIGSKSFQLYKSQNINYNNYKTYFTQKEINLLNYLKANFQVIQEIKKDWSIDIKKPENSSSGYFAKQWENMLFSHITDIYRVTAPKTKLGVKTNLFFVVNNYYIPVSVIYQKILEQLKEISNLKSSNDLIFSNIRALEKGTSDFRKYTDGKEHNVNNLKIKGSPLGTSKDFSAVFQGFLLNLKSLI